jgi:FtsH-binding integral membrane protein
MRERTLAGVCSVVALVIVLAMGFFRIKTPHNIPFFVIYLVLMPFLLVPMTAVNKKLLAWRKARGRDIEEEESN